MLRRRIDTGFATSRSRYIGAGHVIAAGVVNAVAGIILLFSVRSEFVFRSFVSVLELWWTKSRILEHGDVLAFVVSVVVPVGGALVLLVGLWQIIAGIGAVAGKRYTMTVAVTVIGMGTVVTNPFGVIAVILLWCSREQFRDRSAMRCVDT